MSQINFRLGYKIVEFFAYSFKGHSCPFPDNLIGLSAFPKNKPDLFLVPQTAFVSNQKQQALNFSFTKVRGDNYLEKIERRLKVFRKDNLPKLSVGLLHGEF